MKNSISLVALVAAVASAGGVGVSAGAQAVAPAALPAGPAAVDPVDVFAARALTRAVLVDLRSVADPGPGDYELAATLLQAAGDLSGGDADMYRLALAAAQEGGDAARVLELCRRIAKADAADTVAQLQLIEARANASETADGKLAVYAAVLGARGQGIDDAVRSRVAMQSALLKRQRGDAKGYAEDLARAAAMDSSNKQAASLALEYFSERVADPVGRVELLTNLLMADPLDGTTHARLAATFSSAGAAQAALRFYDIAEVILARTGQGLEDAQSADRWLQICKVQGAAVAVRQLTEMVEGPRRQAQLAIDEARLANRELASLQDPAALRLRPDLERVRFACAMGLGDAGTVQRSLADFAAYAAGFAAETPAGSIPAPPELELAFMRLWSGLEVEKARADVARFGEAGVPAEVLARMAAMLKFRDGDVAGARAALTAMQGDVLAMVALAQVEIEGKAEASQIEALLLNVDAAAPDTAASVWAGTVFGKRMGKALPPTPVGERFSAMAKGIPSWVDDVAKDPARFFTMLAVAADDSLEPSQPAMITLRLRHSVPVPLALGPGEVLDSRFLFAATPDYGRGIDATRAAAEVINVDRRLRLEPREELAATVWAEPGAAGWSIQSAIRTMVRVRFRIVNGFQMINGAPHVVGFGAATEVGPLQRGTPALGRLNDFVASIGSARGQAFADTLAAARGVLLDAGSGGGVNLSDGQAISTALAKRYAAESPAGRLLMLAQVPTRGQSLSVNAFEAAVRSTPETSAVVRMAALLTRVDGADDALLAAAESSGEPVLARAAAAVKGRLVGGRGGYGTLKVTTPPTPPGPPGPPVRGGDGAPAGASDGPTK